MIHLISVAVISLIIFSLSFFNVKYKFVLPSLRLIRDLGMVFFFVRMADSYESNFRVLFTFMNSI